MKTAKVDRADRNRKAIAGIRKHYASIPTMVLDGVTFATADVETALQGSIDAADATAAATAVFHKTVEAEKTANARGDAVYGGLKAFVTTQFKASPESMADFGFTPPTRRVPDAATKADAVVKRSSTRAARHTMGKRQKEKVKGTSSTTDTSAGPAPAAAAQTSSATPTKPAAG